MVQFSPSHLVAWHLSLQLAVQFGSVEFFVLLVFVFTLQADVLQEIDD